MTGTTGNREFRTVISDIIPDRCGTERHFAPVAALTKTSRCSYPLPMDLSTGDWVYATRTRNYCKYDPLLDFLELHGTRLGFQRDEAYPDFRPELQMLPFIVAKGFEFERRVVEAISEKAAVVMIERDEPFARYQKTLQAMADGADVIVQGMVMHEPSRTYGRPDLIVRADRLARLFVGPPELERGAPKNYYVIIDVKYKAFQLRASGTPGGIEDKKAQLFIYNRALGAMQGFTPRYAYMIGRSVTQFKGSKDGGGCFLRACPVDPNEVAALADDAVEWIRLLEREGHDWVLEPQPSRKELHPNASNIQDDPWHRAKKEIITRLRPLSSLWFVTPKNIDAAVKAGITRWDDVRLRAEIFGLSADRTRILNHILATQRGEEPLNPGTVMTLRDEWKVKKGPEFFVDFEYVSDLDDDFSQFPQKGGNPRIYMIGCGHEEDGRWQFECFIANRLDENGEREMLTRWIDHVYEVNRRLGGGTMPTVFHWSPAETSTFQTAYNSASTRLRTTWSPLGWFDLLNRVIKIEPVTAKGALAFGLKPIAKAMHSHGLIETNWEDGPMDGLAAMLGGWHCEHEAAARGCCLRDIELMEEIRRYNEIDCRVMWEIVEYLRSHH